MYAFFERLFDPLASAPVVQPPDRTARFFWAFLRPVRGLLLLTLVIAGVGALAELALYAFLGVLVDWMIETGPDQFWDSHAPLLIAMMTIRRALFLLFCGRVIGKTRHLAS